MTNKVEVTGGYLLLTARSADVQRTFSDTAAVNGLAIEIHTIGSGDEESRPSMVRPSVVSVDL